MINPTLVIYNIKRSRKLIVIWSTVWTGMIALTWALFDAVKDQGQLLEEMLKTLPKGFADAFMLDAQSITSIEGYFSARMLTLYLIAGVILAAYVYAGIGREISSRTVTFLLAKPYRRTFIFLSKAISATFTIMLVNVILGVISYIGADIFTGDVEVPIQYFLVVFTALTLMQIMFGAFASMISVIVSDSAAVGTSALLSIFSFIINAIGSIDGVPEFVKFTSPNYYLHLEEINKSHTMTTPDIWIFPLLAVVFLIAGAWWFNKQDINA